MPVQLSDIIGTYATESQIYAGFFTTLVVQEDGITISGPNLTANIGAPWTFTDTTAHTAFQFEVTLWDRSFVFGADITFTKPNDVWCFAGHLSAINGGVTSSGSYTGANDTMVAGELTVTKITCVRTSSGIDTAFDDAMYALVAIGGAVAVGGTAFGAVPVAVVAGGLAVAAGAVDWLAGIVGHALPDQVKIAVGTDGVDGTWGPVNMHSGDTQTPNLVAKFRGNKVALAIWEVDVVSADDLLGQIVIGPIDRLDPGQSEVVNQLSIISTAESSIYEISYIVKRLANVPGTPRSDLRYVRSQPVMPPPRPGATWTDHPGMTQGSDWSGAILKLSKPDLAAAKVSGGYLPNTGFMLVAEQAFEGPGVGMLAPGDVVFFSGKPDLVPGPATISVLSLG